MIKKLQFEGQLPIVKLSVTANALSATDFVIGESGRVPTHRLSMSDASERDSCVSFLQRTAAEAVARTQL